jgi:leader peptidase (prepilin peptidase) / N-methyltransferase
MDPITTIPFAILALMFGAAFGSFLNVVIYRVPAGLSVLHPPSRCPHCLNPLRRWENVPVFGWLWLKGKCGHCQAPISPRYPIVEAITALLFLAAFVRFGLSPQTLGYWLFLCILIALALIDWDTMTLPNPILKFGVVSGLTFQTLLGFSHQANLSGAMVGFFIGTIGAVLGVLLLDAITLMGSFVFRQPAMGDGDAYLAGVMGAWLGWKLFLMAGFLACLGGATIGGAAIALGGMSRYQKMPFGPYLALGSVLALFFGEALMAGYRQLLFAG